MPNNIYSVTYHVSDTPLDSVDGVANPIFLEMEAIIANANTNLGPRSTDQIRVQYGHYVDKYGKRFYEAWLTILN